MSEKATGAVLNTPSSNDAYDSNSQVVDNDDLVEILQQTEAAQQGDCCQIVDGDGNLITITAEQLANAGIDITKISDNDVQTLMQLAQAASAMSGSSPQHHHHQMTSGLSEISKSGKRRMGASPARDQQSTGVGDVHNTLLDEKILKKPKLIAEHEVSNHSNDEDDITELDEATLASLVESGSVKFVDEAGNEIPASSVMVAAQGASMLRNVSGSPLLSSEQRKTLNTNEAVPRITRSALKVASSPLKTSSSSSANNSALLGLDVRVKRGNRRIPATIRYVRPGIGYKVQFEDGRFEWVGENDVVLPPSGSRTATPVSSEASGVGVAPSADHEYLLDDEAEIDDDDEESSSLNGAAVVNVSMETGSDTGSAAIASTSTAPSLLRKTLNGGSASRFRSIPQQKKAAATSSLSTNTAAAAATTSASTSSTMANSNFVCPICETKVCNKEPSYIVIRLPACDECAESKILVLDENAK